MKILHLLRERLFVGSSVMHVLLQLGFEEHCIEIVVVKCTSVKTYDVF